MRTNTKEKILKFLEKKERTVSELVERLGFSNQAIHKHLRELQQKNEIGKKGKMPKVFYFKKRQDESRILESKRIFEEKLLPVFLEKIKKNKITFWNLPTNKKLNFDFLLTSSALYSSNIEGNTLDLNSFLNKKTLSKKRKKEAVEIEDLKKAYLFAQEYQLSEGNLLQTHKILSKNLISKNRQGNYRKESVGVFGNSGLTYLAIEHNLLKNEMNLFFEQIDFLLAKKMEKEEIFFWSLWLHLTLALIHPFADGNGRIARIMEKWFLAQKLDRKYWYLQTEKYYWEHLKKYYQNLALGSNYWEVKFRKAKGFLTNRN